MITQPRCALPAVLARLAATGLVLLLTLGAASLAHAQDDAAAGRFVVVLDVTGRDGGKVSDEFRRMFRDYPHVVFSEGEFVAAGERAGVGESRFWDTPALMAEVARAEGVDAVVAGHMERDRKKRYELTVFVFEARTGEIAGEFTINLGKKARISDKDLRELGELANQFVVDTGQVAIEPDTVAITVSSQPSGARVLRDGKVLGETPLTIEVPRNEATEVWELTWGEQPAGIARVDLSGDNRYDVVLSGIDPDSLPGAQVGGDDDGPVGALETGGGLPVFEVGISTDITGRSLTVETNRADVGLNYSSSAYPVFSLEAAFFPLTLFVDNPYAAGVGIKAYGGFGSLQSRIPVIPGGPQLTRDNTECGGTGDPNFIECPTDHSEFGFGATYRLLLEDDGRGGLDAQGMALSFDASYTWLVFDVGANPTYEGHGYQGLELGVGFSTPLGLPELRLDAAFDFTQALTFGAADMIANWGQSASGFGLAGNLEVGYEIIAGLFAEVGYSGQFFSTSYEGTGCQGLRPDNSCAINPESSVASDQYHQGIIRLGYRLH